MFKHVVAFSWYQQCEQPAWSPVLGQLGTSHEGVPCPGRWLLVSKKVAVSRA